MVTRIFLFAAVSALILLAPAGFLPGAGPGGFASAQETGTPNDGRDDNGDGSNGRDRWEGSRAGDAPPGGGTPSGGIPPGATFVPIPVQTPPRRIQPPAPVQQAPVVVDLPLAVEGEIVTANLGPADLQALLDQGFTLIEEADIPIFAITLRRLGVPGGLNLVDALALVRGLATGQQSDLNHFYRLVQAGTGTCEGVQCPERSLVGWPYIKTRDVACGRGMKIGMIDSGINGGHDTFSGAILDLHQMSPDYEPGAAGGNVHGTSVAALLVGDPGSRSPGLIPGATLVAVDAFHRIGNDTRTDVVTLIKGLAYLAEKETKVINLSLAGPDNALLAGVVGELTLVMNTVVVAAVGNAGPDAEPAYPAAYDPVIAVTGVDRSGAIYEKAVRGAHVDLSAPGVEVWTAASVKGARWKTGTSFAAPFVSAAAAILRQSQPDLDVTAVFAGLQEGAKDLGDPGRDPVFGAGLLNLGTMCDGRL